MMITVLKGLNLHQICRLNAQQSAQGMIMTIAIMNQLLKIVNTSSFATIPSLHSSEPISLQCLYLFASVCDVVTA